MPCWEICLWIFSRPIGNGNGSSSRGVEIVSEASRRLTDELKARHPEIPWQKVAGIGNVLRHDYESIAAPVMWKLAQADLQALEKVCREELVAELAREKRD
jgi:uncharacterized protein with HEPN domain